MPIEIPVPKDDVVCETIMHEFKNDKGKLAAEDCASLELQIDQLVEQLYDLSNKDRALVQDYVTRFSAGYIKRRRHEVHQRELSA
jgi:hypothetical protein